MRQSDKLAQLVSFSSLKGFLLLTSPILISFPRNIECNFQGFSWLAQVSAKLRPLWKTAVRFDARSLRFFDGNLCAPFGALLCDAQKSGVSVSWDNISGGVLEVWSKNEFSRSFGGATMNDIFDTTLAYRQFPLNENPKSFAGYVTQELMSKDLPQMSDEMRREFARSIQEIFDNAQMHSQSASGVFGCGQFFPSQERLAFTLTDLGVGFRRTVEQKTGRTFQDKKAIAWAIQVGHSARAEHGGYGLPTLKEFFARNKGRLQIVSGSGFWELNQFGEQLNTLPHAFPGSFVNMEINTSDETYHQSSTELVAESLKTPLF